ncbi:hypothetical protein J6590_093375 [Homalodisca vitripennis]|nr:hypothetical protein J6590_093375 [Homalodisca vitripennis]
MTAAHCTNIMKIIHHTRDRWTSIDNVYTVWCLGDEVISQRGMTWCFVDRIYTSKLGQHRESKLAMVKTLPVFFTGIIYTSKLGQHRESKLAMVKTLPVFLTGIINTSKLGQHRE